MSDFAVGATFLAVIAGIVLLAIAYVFVPMGYRNYVNHQVLADGLPATATVVSLDDTGNRINDQPVIKITLHVMPPNGTAFDATVQRIITVASYAGLAPGSVLNVKYNPNDHRQVAIVYGSQ
ncbi:MAG: hypothetical protein B7Z75_02125 [Acidocella sp. 20-57-95]|nr:MAG: hypothetical protein B7Z75_02125 [Acidocella sp. 20-57-95]OYV59156.1 MAG: hypothetical protein B7Z71_08670 [Acidocella sp. 21-58-7]HQT63800.1 hypothetical protein [Acidocella sp.]